jgi:RNA polymerase sigma-54 factor
VAARDLQECLSLQLAGMGLEDSLEGRIVKGHLKDLEARRLKKIARDEKTTVEDVVRAARVIAGLEPIPGRPFSLETVQYVVPDITIHKVGDEYQVQLIDEGLPHLRVNGFYRRLYRSGKLTGEDKDFIEKKINSARWLIKSILQRQQTIIRVAKSIVKFQREFLDHGIKHLKPLVLRTVAEDINMHESTVSRVTSRKYAQTSQGILELKYFFNSGISRSGGESMASVSVMDLIRGLIEQEDTQRPLSDLEIVRLLQRDHFLTIARRTVAKYRSLLNIMPASRRRQPF